MSGAAMAQPAGKRRGQRGVSLIEVLVAFFILFVVTLAVLQMLSMAYLVNLGSLTRTDLTYRAQRVVETIRLQSYLTDPNNKNLLTPSALANLGCCPVTAGSYTIPPSSCTSDFWGPSGANVMEANARYSLSYTISGGTVTVNAVPLTTGSNLYLGPVANKAVVYVAQIQ
jgi:Tfp pilus assembly protein PilV